MLTIYIFPVLFPYIPLKSWRHSCRSTIPNRSPCPTYRRGSSRIQIIHISSSTLLVRISLAWHCTRIFPHKSIRLWSRCHTTSVTFTAIFNTGVEIRCCWFGGETGKCGGNAKIRSHAVVAEEFWHVVSAVGAACWIGEAS
jgi:hypothetical protein